MGVESRQDKRDESPRATLELPIATTSFRDPASCIEANVSRCPGAGSSVPHRATSPPRSHVPSNEGNGRFQIAVSRNRLGLSVLHPFRCKMGLLDHLGKPLRRRECSERSPFAHHVGRLYLSAGAGAPALAGLGRLTVPAAAIDHDALSMPPPGIVGSYAPEGPAPKAWTLPTMNLALEALHDMRHPLMVTGAVRLPQLLTLNHDGIRCRLLGPKLLKVNT